jgi:eukaryotic-like serine/threonine-protein kinase
LKAGSPGVTVETEAAFMQRSVDGTAIQPRACLDEQEAVDFAGGLLPLAKMASVEAHLAGCEACTALIAAAAPHLGAGAVRGSSPTQVTQSIETQPIGPAPEPRSGSTRERPRLAAGTPLDSTYQVVRFLGRGGMGDVYEVKHARLAGRYAAKLLSTDLADNAQAFSRFQREALIASGLNHPNIVNVIDFCHLPDGLPCLVMEYLDGVDLAEVMSRGPLSLARTLRLVRQIVSALGTLHGHQIIHRDLKPQNIFVLPESDGHPERVKLVDFGLAKRSNPSMVVTHDRTLLGTPQYMAPEQAIGSADSVGPESDQFSLGAIVYEMLAGRHPFQGEVLSTVLYRIVHEPAAPLASVAPDVPPYVAAAIDRALAKDRQARFPSVKVFLQALEDEGPAMTPTPTPGPFDRQQRRSWFIRREVLASAGVLLATAGVVGVFRVIRRPVAEPAYWEAGGRGSTGVDDQATGASATGAPPAQAAGPARRRDPLPLGVEARPASVAAPRPIEIQTADGNKARPAGAARASQGAAAHATAGARTSNKAPPHAAHITGQTPAAVAAPVHAPAPPPLAPTAVEPAPIERKTTPPLLIEKL